MEAFVFWGAEKNRTVLTSGPDHRHCPKACLSPVLLTYFPLVWQLFAHGTPSSKRTPKIPQKLGLVVEGLHANKTLQQVSVVLIRAGFVASKHSRVPHLLSF